MKIIFFFARNCFKNLRIEAFGSEERPWFSREESKVRPFLKQKLKSSIFKKMLFTEIGETNKGHLYSLFFVFAAQWNREWKFLFLIHTNVEQPKDQTVKSAPNSKSDSYWLGRSRFVSATWWKINSDHFCF